MLTTTRSAVFLLLILVFIGTVALSGFGDTCSITSQSPNGSVDVGRSYSFKITLKFTIDSPGSLTVNWVEGMNAYSQRRVSSEVLADAGSYTRTISYTYISPCNKIHNLVWFNVVLSAEAHGTFTRSDGKTPRTGWYTQAPSAIQPKINIPSTIRANVSASFSDGTLHPEAISMRKWLVDGVEAGNGKTLSHTFPQEGTYQLELSVQDVCTGEWSNTTTTIHAQPEFIAPTGKISYTPSVCYVGREVIFSVTGLKDSNGGTVRKIEWDFGDGSTAKGRHAAHSYASAGRYSVTLRLTNDHGLVTTVHRTITARVPTAESSGVSEPQESLYVSFNPGKSRSASLEAKQVDSSNDFVAVYTPHVEDDWGGLYKGFSVSGFPKQITGDSLIFEYKLTSRAIEVFVEIADCDGEYFVCPLSNLGKSDEWHEATLQFSDFEREDTNSSDSGNRIIDQKKLRAITFNIVGLYQVGQSTTMEIKNIHFVSTNVATRELAPLDFYSISANSGGGADISAREITPEDGLSWEGTLVTYTPRTASGWDDLYSEVVLRGFPNPYDEAANAQALLITYACDNPDLVMGAILFERSGEGYVYNVYEVRGDSEWHTLVAPFSLFNYDEGYSMGADDNQELDPEKIDSMRIYIAGMDQAGVTTTLRIREVQLSNDIPTDEEYLPEPVSTDATVGDERDGVNTSEGAEGKQVDLRSPEAIAALVPNWDSVPYLVSYSADAQPAEYWIEHDGNWIDESDLADAQHWGLTGSNIKGVKTTLDDQGLIIHWETYDEMAGSQYDYHISFCMPGRSDVILYITFRPDIYASDIGMLTGDKWEDLSAKSTYVTSYCHLVFGYMI